MSDDLTKSGISPPSDPVNQARWYVDREIQRLQRAADGSS